MHWSKIVESAKSMSQEPTPTDDIAKSLWFVGDNTILPDGCC